MTQKIIFIIIVTLLTSGCCNEESIETGRYPLTDEELQLVPYKLGDSIRFIHSKGYEFDFVVSQESMEWQKYSDFCEWTCCAPDYISYQQKTVVLESVYPNLFLNFQLGGYDWGYQPNVLFFEMNRRYGLYIPYDSLGNIIYDNQTIRFYETLRINGFLYYYVIEKEFDYNFSIEDSTLLLPESILYNQYGLLQIKMTNDETYSLKN